MSDDVQWLGTKTAARRLGITLRTLYRIIDEGQVPAYKFGRVIRLKEHEVDAFVEAARITPGEVSHLYPESANPHKKVGGGVPTITDGDVLTKPRRTTSRRGVG